ncbi:MAG: class I SAM-dependent methyltransferase [Acidimicrobiales bacterium]
MHETRGPHHGAGTTSAPEGQAAWDERYASVPSLWSGRPNHALVRWVEQHGAQPGRALDVGCGEGADAVWLASRGWQVTGLDISPVALARAGDAARAAGVEEPTSWVQADLTTQAPPAGPWDLVNVQYLHLRPGERPPLWAALAAVVAPGGALLVVAHDRSDPHVASHVDAFDDASAHDFASRLHDVDEVVAAVGEGWRVLDAGPLRWSRSGGAEPDAVDLVVAAVRAGVH